MPAFPPNLKSLSMADILCLKGDAAFSAFRLQRLQARLVAAVSDIESVVADYWHVSALKRALTAEERAKLATLLEEKAATAESGELFLVAPRIGTISPWSSKATDIAWNCDLDAIERIERVIAFHVVVKNNRALSADEKKTVAGLLHDRMTDSVLPGFDAAGELFRHFEPKPLNTVDVLTRAAKPRWSTPMAHSAWRCPTTKSITCSTSSPRPAATRPTSSS